MLQVCLNGVRSPATGRWFPATPAALAAEARAAYEAGATDIHVHPKDAAGADSLAPDDVARVLRAVRGALPPGVAVGVTTGAWAGPDPAARLAHVRAWAELPDHASVNWHEPGAEELAALLMERGIGVEAGLWSGTDGPARFRASPLAPRTLRILAEVTDQEPASAATTARVLLGAVLPAPVPVLLHGEDEGAWPVLALAAELGLDTRTGLEDTLFLPDGTAAHDNASLVRVARAMIEKAEPQAR
ncbi:3-keto-5-aminohexanoate cleavage protein [Streptomyces sp. NPDC088923]|uniref:3-keto-5-aminohexanoate cleavage protein n=1 Tax=Streptomyces sp. NPDC088923 TaxID=3365913 RepID=UPI0037FCC73C